MTRRDRGFRRGPGRTLALTAAWLPATGNLAAVAPEGELLDEVGDRLPDGSEPHLDLAVRCDVRHTTGQPQGLRQAIMQVNLRYALLTGFG